MLQPKRVKFRKQQRGNMRGRVTSPGASTVHFGEFGLQALEPCWMTSNQIEAARIAMTRHIKRGGKIWIRVFPDKPFTKKPAETRMGKGKGAPEGWVAVVKPGRVLFEMAGVPESLAREAMRLASHKLPIATRFVTRTDALAAEAPDAEETAQTVESASEEPTAEAAPSAPAADDADAASVDAPESAPEAPGQLSPED